IANHQREHETVVDERAFAETGEGLAVLEEDAHDRAGVGFLRGQTGSGHEAGGNEQGKYPRLHSASIVRYRPPRRHALSRLWKSCATTVHGLWTPCRAQIFFDAKRRNSPRTHARGAASHRASLARIATLTKIVVAHARARLTPGKTVDAVRF